MIRPESVSLETRPSGTERLGVLLLLINVPITALFPVLGKAGSSMVHPLVFAALTALTATVALGLFQGPVIGRFLRERGFRAFLRLSPVGFWATGMGSLAFFCGVGSTTGANAAILLQVEPVYALALGWLFLAERPGPRQLLGTACVLLGALVVLWRGSAGFSLGDGLVLLTPLFWQLGHLKARKCLLAGVPSEVITFSRVAVGSLVLFLVLALSRTWSPLPPRMAFWGSVFGVGGLGMALCFALWYRALSMVPMAKATAILSVYPVVAVIMSWCFLGEDPTLRQFAGLAIVMTGLFVLGLSEKGRSEKRLQK